MPMGQKYLLDQVLLENPVLGSGWFANLPFLGQVFLGNPILESSVNLTVLGLQTSVLWTVDLTALEPRT